ncbi:hypothetical protein [Streptacidiphilus carbonis]|jgi:hypothetical protein|uniref:hypothetical protein n=1 Tax=Streptacidiphilus carbonis TaxID=105422 RepID=UPI0005A97E4F|nr:hypothetical protein [Streptacidiphilus carbonis]
MVDMIPQSSRAGNEFTVADRVRAAQPSPVRVLFDTLPFADLRFMSPYTKVLGRWGTEANPITIS